MRTGLLHLGLGAFHRAHQAPYTQDAVAAEGGDWGIEAVSMRTPDQARALAAQGCAYTLVECHPDGPRTRRIDVIRRTHVRPGGTGALIARMADPAIRVVTLTVTEKGYGADFAAGTLDTGAAEVAADLRDPRGAASVPGLLRAGLAARRAEGHGGLTLLSCDNLPENGRVLAGLVDAMARETDPGLADWIAGTCRFPSSMVDRITPATTPETVRLAGDDPCAVETEPFRQWVIEDAFADGRPAWEAAGAEIVADVAPYEAMKLRMLNGSHSLIAYLGALAGLDYVRDVMADARLRAAVARLMAAAAGTLSDRLETEGYAAKLMERFENPAIDHRCLQIAMDGSQKMPQRILAPAADAAAAGGDVAPFGLAVAAWMRFAETAARLDDPLADALRAALRADDAAGKVAALSRLAGLGQRDVLARPDIAAAVAAAYDRLVAAGPRRAV